MKTNQITTLFNNHNSSLLAFALRFTNNLEDAEDLIQETMVKAIRYYSKYEEGSNLRAWLFVIMKNTFINNYRKQLKLKSITTKDEEISSANLLNSATKNGSESAFAMNDIKTALNNLPNSYSSAFIRYAEGYKYHEIAEELNLPIGTIKTHIHQARILLKKQLVMYRENFN